MATALSLFADVEAPSPPSAAYVVTTHHGDNATLIREVSRLYLPLGARVADVTYGQGGFWKKVDLSHYTLMASDQAMVDILRQAQVPLLEAYAPVLLAAQLDALPYRDAAFDVVVLDPPYLHTPGQLQMERTYRNVATTKGMYHRDILRDLYCRGLQEAWRVVRPGGTVWVKGKDEIESGKQCWSHVEVFLAAQRLGLLAREQFWLVTDGGKPRPRGQKQQHADKNSSWLWVFTRPPTVPSVPRGRPKKGRAVSTNKQQRGRSYQAARLLRDHPDVYARYMAGTLASVHAAAVEAGLVKPRRSATTSTQ